MTDPELQPEVQPEVHHFDLSALAPAQRYKLLIGTVVPRPIAWVTTLNAAGQVNLAPFSFFNVFGSDPPIIAFAPGNRPDGTPKDTALNIGSGHEFTVNLVSVAQAQQMSDTATDFPHDQSEPDNLGITLVPGVKVRVPRVQDSPAALECREHQTLLIGQNRLIIGEVLGITLRTDTLKDPARHHVNTPALDLLGRTGGQGGYATTRDQIEIQRLSYTQWQERQQVKDDG